MGVSVVMRGEGDMKKSVYDPDADGVIAVAQTEADVGDMLKSTYDSDEDGIVEDADLSVVSTKLTKVNLPMEEHTVNTTTTTPKTAGYIQYGGTYTIKVELLGDGIYTTYAYYRINRGSWVEIGHQITSSWVVKQATGVSISEGDLVEIGTKSQNASNAGKAVGVLLTRTGA